MVATCGPHPYVTLWAQRCDAITCARSLDRLTCGPHIVVDLDDETDDLT